MCFFHFLNGRLPQFDIFLNLVKHIRFMKVSWGVTSLQQWQGFFNEKATCAGFLAAAKSLEDNSTVAISHFPHGLSSTVHWKERPFWRHMLADLEPVLGMSKAKSVGSTRKRDEDTIHTLMQTSARQQWLDVSPWSFTAKKMVAKATLVFRPQIMSEGP